MTKLVSYRPFTPSIIPSDFGDIFDDFDNIFKGLFGDFGSLAVDKGFPKGEIFKDKNGNTVIELITAGYSKDQLSVKVLDNVVVVSGSKCNDDKETGRTLKRSGFERKFPILTDQYDLEKTEVSYRDGLLKIVMTAQDKVETVKELEIK